MNFKHCSKLVGQSLSAFRTSSLENISAVSCFHSFSETVLFFSLTLFGLVSSKHELHLLDYLKIFPTGVDIGNEFGSVKF